MLFVLQKYHYFLLLSQKNGRLFLPNSQEEKLTSLHEPDTPDGSFLKHVMIYFMFPSGKEAIEKVWKREATLKFKKNQKNKQQKEEVDWTNVFIATLSFPYCWWMQFVIANKGSCWAFLVFITKSPPYSSLLFSSKDYDSSGHILTIETIEISEIHLLCKVELYKFINFAYQSFGVPCPHSASPEGGCGQQ